MLKTELRHVLRLLLMQVSAMLLGAALAMTVNGRAAWSVLVGGAIGLVASAWLLFAMLKHRLQPARPVTVLGLFGNWLLRVLLVVGLLAMSLRSPRVLPAALIAGLVLVLMAYWLAMLRKWE